MTDEVEEKTKIGIRDWDWGLGTGQEIAVTLWWINDNPWGNVGKIWHDAIAWTGVSAPAAAVTSSREGRSGFRGEGAQATLPLEAVTWRKRQRLSAMAASSVRQTSVRRACR
jgi:hypothetical protein